MEIGLVALQPAVQCELTDAEQFVFAFLDVALPSLFGRGIVEQTDGEEFAGTDAVMVICGFIFNS